jgi:[acyl-carrier-protein] S-malonyltransferase
MKILGLFPGQGSQAVGMGADFLRSSELAQEFFHTADKLLGYSLSRLCLEGPLEELTLTQNAQPAILLVSTISYRLAQIPLHAAAGHSLGEYSALVAAGTLKFTDAIQLVHKRGRYMQEAVRPGDGKMVAVLGPTEAEIRDVLSALSGPGIAEIANLNSPGQTVVAGDVQGVDAFGKIMQAQGAKIIPLNVSAPFHCRLMQPAAEKLAQDLDHIDFADPAFPVYSNVEAAVIPSGSAARELLKRQVCASVRWTDSMTQAVSELGLDTAVEFGAGGVLSKLLKRTCPAVQRFEAADMTSIGKLTELQLQK